MANDNAIFVFVLNFHHANRVRRGENLMSCRCLAHRSSVAVGYLSIAVRFLTKTILAIT